MGLGFKLLQHALDALERTTSETGSVVKVVACENCQGEYVYKLTREGQGKGTVGLTLNEDKAHEEARQEAQTALRHHLLNDFDLVPCPFCGWYQRYMVHRLRQARLHWMLTTGVLACLGAVMCGMVSVFYTNYFLTENSEMRALFWTLAALLGISSLVLIAGKYHWSRHYDPNATDVEKRKELGRFRAMSKTDFIKMEQSERSQDR